MYRLEVWSEKYEKWLFHSDYRDREFALCEALKFFGKEQWRIVNDSQWRV